MPVEQVRAFKTSNGTLYESKGQAMREDASERIRRMLYAEGSRNDTLRGVEHTLSKWCVDNAAELVELLTPCTVPHSPTGEEQ